MAASVTVENPDVIHCADIEARADLTSYLSGDGATRGMVQATPDHCDAQVGLGLGELVSSIDNATEYAASGLFHGPFILAVDADAPGEARLPGGVAWTNDDRADAVNLVSPKIDTLA